MKKTLLSGIKSTGQLHIGNYFGAMRQFVSLQDEYDSYVFVADLHSLTSVHDAEKMRSMTLDIAAAYLSIGLDPEKVTLFKQSDVPEVTELAWIFECLTTVPYLMRAHAYKDAIANNTEPNVGLFNYPLLMAADILIYDADVVPVGRDQKQHIEYARDTADKFNRIFGETFRLPEPLIQEEVETIPGIDGRKMSKSYDNTIPLFGTDEEVRKSVMSIKTDSKNLGETLDPNTDTVFAFHQLVATKEEIEDLERKYRAGEIGYGDSKKLLAERLLEYFGPARERFEELQKDQDHILTVFENGAKRAKERASKKIEAVRRAVGLL